MKRRTHKWLAILLAFSLLLTLFSSVAFAEGGDMQAAGGNPDSSQSESSAPETGEQGSDIPVEPAEENPSDGQVACTKSDACAAQTHEDGCPKKDPGPTEGDGSDPSDSPLAATTNALLTGQNTGGATPLSGDPVTDEDSLRAAIDAIEGSGTVTLDGSFALSGHITIDKDVTLNLNGQTLTMGSYSFKIAGGGLTIQDASDGAAGKITGTGYIVDMNTSGGDTVTLQSGTLEGTGWSAVAKIASGDTFNMTGGTAKQTQNNASYVLLVNTGGTANVTGGRIEGSIRGIYASASSSSVTVGAAPAGSIQTPEEAQKVYVSAVYAGNANANIALNSGTVGKVFGKVGTDFVLNCWFEEDVSSYLPAGLMCAETDGHWVVSPLTEENAAARIGDTLYGSLVKAADELQDEETLVVLKNYTGSEAVTIKVDRATVELNGYSITNNAEDGYGLEITSDSSAASGETGVVIQNTGDGTSVVTAAIPLHAHSGNSLKPMPLALEGDIRLISSSEPAETLIELGTAAYLEYNEEIASYITSGGFLATHSDGKQYVHGNFTQAATNDRNKTATLLNDYEGGISLSSEDSLTLDLNKKTVTSNGTSVIRVNTNNATLTIKNGTMITENGTGAEVGIPASGGWGGTVTYHNVTLNLENVDLTAKGSAEDDYGIVCNGTSTGIHINLKGGSVSAPNTIGIYFPPAESTLTIDGTKITGTTGVAVKGGTVTISNEAEINGTGTASEPSEGAQSGVNNTGAALYVEGNYNRTVTVNIDNSTFISKNGKAVQMLEDTSASGEKDIVITSGAFSSDVEEKFLAPGAKKEGNEGTGFTVGADYVAMIGETGYISLASAIESVQDSQTIKLVDDVTLLGTHVINGTDITLDLNGRTISGSVATNGLIRASTGTTLTITDSTDGTKGTIVNSAQSTSRAVYVDKGATLVLDGGVNLKAEGTSSMNYAAALYIIADNENPPVVTIHNANLTATKGYAVRFSSSSKAAALRIEGGTFSAPDISASAQLFGNDKAGNITITGGTFHNWSSTSDKPMVADGYSLVVGTDNSVTVAETAPSDYAAAIKAENAYLAKGGDLFNLIRRTGFTSGTIEIADNITCTYPGNSNQSIENGFGSKYEDGPVAALSLDIAQGATLSGSMPLYVADVTVTGGGTVTDSFFPPVSDTYTVTSSETPEGTVYSGRIAEDKLIASVILDGETYHFTDILAASNYAKRNAGSVLKLHQDVEYNSTIFPASSDPFDWTLDLNGHTYTYTGKHNAFQVQYTDKSLTITDSSEKGGGKIAAPSASAVIATTNTSVGATVVIDEGVTIEGTILITGRDATLDIYGVIDTTGSSNAAVQTNGSNTEDSTINIYGSAVVRADTHAIYHPGTGTLNIYDGAAVEGGNVGIEMRAGTLNVYGNATITGGTGTPGSEPNGSGTTSSNAAVAIAQHTTGNPVIFNAYGGTYTGGAAVYESSPEGNDPATTEKVELNIRDGMFDGAVSSENKAGFVSGGTFTEPLTNSYVYPGLTAVEDGEGNYTVDRLQDVYVDGTNGDDNHNGTDSQNAVKTLEHAMKLVADDGVIYICGKVTVASSLTISGVTIKRADNYSGHLIRTKSTSTGEPPVDLTLSDAVIDGNKENNAESTGYLITVGCGSTVRLEDGAVLKNNPDTAVYISAATTTQPVASMIINGGVITGNGNPHAIGGAIYNCGDLEMIDGEISNNTAESGGGINNNSVGEVLLTGGEIKNNTATDNGGGIMTVDGTVTLDGASITGNTSQSGYGGGISVENSGDNGSQVVFEMKRGTISDNTASNDTGSEIFGWCDNGADVIIQISGGTIAGEEGNSRLIALYGQTADAYPTLKLSGSPNIAGGIFLQDGADASGYRITVTDDFTPVTAIPIERQNNAYGVVAVEYAKGLTPNLDDFAPYRLTDALTVNGQTLEWAEASGIYFYDEDGTEYADNRHSVMIGGKIDPSDVPAPEKPGYTLVGWQEKDATGFWNFDTDTVSAETKLYAVWRLDAPVVSVAANTSSTHEDMDATLTATASHDAKGVTYSYQWYKDGIAIAGETKNTLAASESGSYTVKVTANDGSRTSAETESSPVVITVEGHVYVPVVTAPTCTERGYTTHTCTICGDSYVDSYTDPTGHISDGGVVTTPATETQTGVKTYTCTVCGQVIKTETIPATGGGIVPMTGDPVNMTLYIVLFAVAAVVAVILVIYLRKRKTSR